MVCAPTSKAIVLIVGESSYLSYPACTLTMDWSKGIFPLKQILGVNMGLAADNRAPHFIIIQKAHVPHFEAQFLSVRQQMAMA